MLFFHSSLFTLQTSSVGPEGVEPTPCGLKVRRAAWYTTTLNLGAAYAFKLTNVRHACLLLFLKPQVSSLTSRPVVVLRIERSVIRLSAEFRQPAFDYHSSRAPLKSEE